MAIEAKKSLIKMHLVTYKINYDIKSSNLMQLCNVQMTCMKFDLEIRKYEKSTRLKTNDTKNLN